MYSGINNFLCEIFSCALKNWLLKIISFKETLENSGVWGIIKNYLYWKKSLPDSNLSGRFSNTDNHKRCSDFKISSSYMS